MSPFASLLREHADAPPLAADVDLSKVGAYRGHAEVLRELAGLVEAGAREEIAGRSVAGEPIPVLEIGERGAERVSVLIAGLHAMEWIGVEVGLSLMKALVANPPVDRRVVCFPLVNVDGYRRAEEDLRLGRRAFRRTNRNAVDLNRNWPTHWTGRHVRARVFPWLGHGGAHARSEPEVDAVCARLDRELTDGLAIDVALSLHSFGRMILYPYGGRWRPPHAGKRLRRTAEGIRDQIPTRYRAVQSSHWVPGAFARGMELDHLHAYYGATALLVECSGGGLRLSDPSSWLHPFRWFNPPDPERECERLVPALSDYLRGTF